MRVAQTIKLVRLGDFLNLKSNLEDALTYLKIELLDSSLVHMITEEIVIQLVARDLWGTSSKT